MIDINLIRENPEIVKENIKKKFQDEKIKLVDEIIKLDKKWREIKYNADKLRSERNKLSNEINSLMKNKEKAKAQPLIKKSKKVGEDIEKENEKAKKLESEIEKILLNIPNIIDKTVPIGKDDTENKEIEKIGEPKTPDYEILNHAILAEKLNGLDLESSRKTSGQGFYFLKSDIARLHSAILNFAKDYMIDKGFSYTIPPFMIRSDVVSGVMSFEEMDDMMYKIEGEDLFLIGTSEHSVIGMFKDTTLTKKDVPQKLTAYSPCFRKEKGAHGIEEKGLYRTHQFEKQEMIIICEPEDSAKFYEEMVNYTVEIHKKLNIPVRKLECCSGDLADLKAKSVDVEAWSPRQKKYFEVGSCSNLTDAQARRLKIKINGSKGNYFAHTLNNTALSSPRALIAFMENNQDKNGSIKIPKVLQRYMGDISKIEMQKR